LWGLLLTRTLSYQFKRLLTETCIFPQQPDLLSPNGLHGVAVEQSVSSTVGIVTHIRPIKSICFRKKKLPKLSFWESFILEKKILVYNFSKQTNLCRIQRKNSVSRTESYTYSRSQKNVPKNFIGT